MSMVSGCPGFHTLKLVGQDLIRFILRWQSWVHSYIINFLRYSWFLSLCRKLTDFSNQSVAPISAFDEVKQPSRTRHPHNCFTIITSTLKTTPQPIGSTILSNFSPPYVLVESSDMHTSFSSWTRCGYCWTPQGAHFVNFFSLDRPSKAEARGWYRGPKIVRLLFCLLRIAASPCRPFLYLVSLATEIDQTPTKAFRIIFEITSYKLIVNTTFRGEHCMLWVYLEHTLS